MGTPQVLIGPGFKHSVLQTNLGKFFFTNAEINANRICQIDGTNDTSETYASVKLRSARAAIAMKERGLTSYDVISICSANTLDNTIPMIAAFCLGVQVTNLQTTASAILTKHLLNLVIPKMIFVEESAVKLIEDSLVNTGIQTEIIVFGSYGKYTSFSEFVKEQKGETEFRPDDNIEPDDLALIIFSKGTTGPPKAVCHTHRSYTFMILQGYHFIVRENIFHAHTFHSMGALIMFGCAFRAGTYRLFHRNPTAENVFRLIQKYKVAHALITPNLIYEMATLKSKDKYDISSLQMIMSGGARMTSSQKQKIIEAFKRAIFSCVYGMCEVGLVTGFNPRNEQKHFKKKFNSIGKPSPGVILKVVQINGTEVLTRGQQGEICLRTSSMMKGYLNLDNSDIFDAEGFFKTGDVGFFDSEECVYVTDRIKEVFMYQSSVIIPSSLEEVLMKHPAIIDAVVFGVPGNDQDGQLPAACIVLQKDCELNEQDIDEYISDHVSDKERLRGGVNFVDALPETPSGKRNRKEIRDSIIKN